MTRAMPDTRFRVAWLTRRRATPVCVRRAEERAFRRWLRRYRR